MFTTNCLSSILDKLQISFLCSCVYGDTNYGIFTGPSKTTKISMGVAHVPKFDFPTFGLIWGGGG